jgi:hypothetical protein
MGLGTKAYDPAQVLVTLAGIEIKGWAPTTKVKVSFPKIYNKVVGLDGEVGRGKNNNRTCSVMFSLMQTSVSNDELMALFAADDAAPAGLLVPFFLKNLNGTTIITAPAAWLELPNDVGYGPEVGVNEWSVDCGETVPFIGGQAAVG